MKKVTVIIPTFNNKEEILNRLINSLDNQTMDSNDFDVIFIDDGSSDFNAYKRLKEKLQIVLTFIHTEYLLLVGQVDQEIKESIWLILNMYSLVMMMILFFHKHWKDYITLLKKTN
ncbi:glycosyltransferase [Staphylococcus pseudoxylosus]|uniref:glycosyltransferase n=1 Tax=Staphylococcus pseudoxylosus TaxID=2282419 RepID=UPI00398B4732